VSVTDIQTGIVQTANYSVAFPYIGLITSQTKVDGATSIMLSTITNSYDSNSGCGAAPAGSGVYVDCLTQSVVVSNDLNGAAFPTATTAYTYDNYGNALTVDVSLTGGSSKNTTNTYLNDTANWFLGRLLTTSVNSIVGSSNLTRQSSFAYDASTGLLTQEIIEPGVSTCNGGSSSCTLSTSYTYDLFGHRVTTTVYGASITTRTSYAFYDSNGQFQTAAANALGQYESWTYDPAFGGPASHTGPNFLTTSWAYDGFGRPTLETRPDGTKTAQSYGYCTGSCPTYGQFTAQSELLASDGVTQIGPINTTTYDMLSRGIASDSQGFDGSTIRVSTNYDDKGRVQQTSRPYYAGSASPAWTHYIYDALGRATRATFPDASHTDYGYNGLTTTVTNNLGQVTTTLKNAQGLNYQITDATSHATTYIYDAFGDLLTVTDPLGNVITNSYDVRGNKIASHDPDMGSWSYAYDVLSELTSQTDAKSQTATLSYDVLGRPLSRSEPGLYSAWTYGTLAAAHNVGQLIEAKACAAAGCASLVSDKTYLYDGLSRQIASILQTPTDYFGYGTTYNATNGQIASVTYPSGYVVNRTYNSQGYLARLTGAGNQPIWAVNARDAELHLISQRAGNGVVTTQSFDPLTGLIQNQRAGPGNAVASFDYAFDTIGNMSSRTDNTQPFTERFCYDSLNRLTNYNIGAACTGGSSAGYDVLGNITSKSGVGSYSYPGSGASSVRPHAVSAITGMVDGLNNPQYSYDANGNLTCVSSGASCGGSVGRTVSLTSFNMAATLAQNGTSLALSYDDQHQRLRQVDTGTGPAVTTDYLNDPASGAMSQRVTTGSNLPTFTDYITLDGQIVAQRSVQYTGSPAWGSAKWNAFQWGRAAAAVANWNSFAWGTANWSGVAWGGFKWGAAPWSGPVVTWEYFSLDHLGSVAVITNQSGNVVQRLSYDAWGKQRHADGSDAACGAITNATTRGFTNQEQMPVGCTVNLNARLYDPSIGKFMAADSIIPDPFNGQSFNRYAYVTNNPLSFTDPTGHDIADFRNSLDPRTAFASADAQAAQSDALVQYIGSFVLVARKDQPTSQATPSQQDAFHGSAQTAVGAEGSISNSTFGYFGLGPWGEEQAVTSAFRTQSHTANSDSAAFVDAATINQPLNEVSANSAPKGTNGSFDVNASQGYQTTSAVSTGYSSINKRIPGKGRVIGYAQSWKSQQENRAGAEIKMDYEGNYTNPYWTTHWQQSGSNGTSSGDDPVIYGQYYDQPSRYFPGAGNSVTWTTTITLYATAPNGSVVPVGTMNYGFENSGTSGSMLIAPQW
jgi:RHS repeat-associated protein